MEEQSQNIAFIDSKPGIATKRRLVFGDFVFYPTKQELFYGDTLCQLEPKMLQLISALIEVRPQCVSKEDLMATLWPDSTVSDWSLARLVSDTRKLIEYEGQQQPIIKTVRGRGFAFIAPTDEIIEAYPQTAMNSERKGGSDSKPRDVSAIKLHYLFVGLVIATILLSVYFIKSHFQFDEEISSNKIEHAAAGHRLEVMHEMQKNLILTKTTFFAQLRRRSELNKLLLDKFPEDKPLSSENRIRLRYPKLTESELFIFAQIRAMTEGPMYQGNKAIVVLLDKHPELYQELKVFNPLNSHLQIWLNKFDKIFKLRKDMCLVYVGTEDGVPFPSEVDELVESWIKEKTNGAEEHEYKTQ